MHVMTLYSVFLLDLDHTLLDSHASEIAAFDHTLRSIGADPSPSLFDRYVRINTALWAGVERGDVTPVEVSLLRFEQLCAETGLDADPGAMSDAFRWGLGAHGDLYPGAREVLEQLAESAATAMITNGLGSVQRDRIERLELSQYFDHIIISAEVGASKPGTAIFDIAFDQLGNPDRTTSVMVGDSLSSDIRGGTNARIATCWYNPDNKVAGDGHQVTHEISQLEQLPAFLSERRPNPTRGPAHG